MVYSPQCFMFLVILTTFHLIIAFLFNCRWVSQLSLFYHIIIHSNISILSVIYRTCNFFLFKYTVGTLFAITIQLFGCIYLFSGPSGQFRWETVFCTHFVSKFCIFTLKCWPFWIYPLFHIPRISRMLVRIWESQFSSVSGQIVRLEDIFNIVVYAGNF